MHTVVIPVTADISAGTDVSIPKFNTPISAIVKAYRTKKADITHEACGATGAAYATATVLGSPTDTVEELDVTLKDDYTVTVNADMKAGEAIILQYIAVNEIEGF